MVRVLSSPSTVATLCLLLCSSALASFERDVAPHRQLQDACNINDAVFFEQFVYLDVQGDLSQVTRSDVASLQNAFQQAYDQAVSCTVGFRQVTKVTIFTNPFGTGTPPSGTVTSVWYANVRSLCLGISCNSELFIYDGNSTSSSRALSEMEAPQEVEVEEAPRRRLRDERRNRGSNDVRHKVRRNLKGDKGGGDGGGGGGGDGGGKKDKKAKNKSAPKDFLVCGGGKKGKKSAKCPGQQTLNPTVYTAQAPASAPVAQTVSCVCDAPGSSSFLVILNQILSQQYLHVTVVLGISSSNNFPESLTYSPTTSPSMLTTIPPTVTPAIASTTAPTASQSSGTPAPSQATLGAGTPLPTSTLMSDSPSLSPSTVPSGNGAAPVAQGTPAPSTPVAASTTAPTRVVASTSTAPTAGTAAPSSATGTLAPSSSLVCPCGNGNRGTGVCFDTSLCCSPYGYCGTGTPYCGNINNSTSLPCGNGQVGNGVCADSSLCCSQFGYCGVGSQYCGSSNSSATAAPTTTTTQQLPCGNGIRGTGTCSDTSLCCSPCGYCGNGTGYCN